MMSEKTRNIFRGFLFFWLPFFAWALVIYLFSSVPTVRTTEIDWGDFIVKKSAHIVEFFIFSLLLYRALLNSKVEMNRWMVLLIVVTAFFYGLTDEYHQSFTPGRGPMIRDVMIDTSGSILFIFSLKYLALRFEKLSKLAKMLQLIL